MKSSSGIIGRKRQLELDDLFRRLDAERQLKQQQENSEHDRSANDPDREGQATRGQGAGS
jgi:hypothetical protein